MIPKIFMQTSRQKPQQYVVDMIKERCVGWAYEHYTDDDIIAFFGENPVPEFPNVIAKFYMLNYGEHRADLFRYYFLYVKGGVYMDLDAMIQYPIENIIGNAEFFTVNSSYFPGTVFQGFLGATPKHPLIYQALKDIYDCPLENLRKEFHLLCKNLYGFIQSSLPTNLVVDERSSSEGFAKESLRSEDRRSSTLSTEGALRDSRLGSSGTPTKPPGGFRNDKPRSSLDVTVKSTDDEQRILLLEEIYGGCEEEAHVINKDKQVVLIHYHIKKIIPTVWVLRSVT